MKINRITFVWHADFNLSGGLNAIKEVWNNQHSCPLCEIAYNRFTQTKEWKAYKKQLAKRFKTEIRQPCRNQLSDAEQKTTQGISPVVLAHTIEGIQILLDDKEIGSCLGNFQQFKQKLNVKIEKITTHHKSQTMNE